MFGLFKRKTEPETVLNALIKSTWGKGAKKTANLTDAIPLAADELLGGLFDKQAVTGVLTRLDSTSIPYSTHDLATHAALHVLRTVAPAEKYKYMLLQMQARMRVLSWTQEGKVAKGLCMSFEDTLYKEYSSNRGAA